MVFWLASEGQRFGFKRALLEPYLEARLGVNSSRISFQGCYAARHDDHIHVETER